MRQKKEIMIHLLMKDGIDFDIIEYMLNENNIINSRGTTSLIDKSTRHNLSIESLNKYNDYIREIRRNIIKV